MSALRVPCQPRTPGWPKGQDLCHTPSLAGDRLELACICRFAAVFDPPALCLRFVCHPSLTPTSLRQKPQRVVSLPTKCLKVYHTTTHSIQQKQAKSPQLPEQLPEPFPFLCVCVCRPPVTRSHGRRQGAPHCRAAPPRCLCSCRPATRHDSSCCGGCGATSRELGHAHSVGPGA